jgi:D-serine deaminase-like pyridoxal phosphate-dependent protein
VARLLQLIQQYPKTQFACLVDHALAAAALQEAARQTSIQLRVFIDLNIGMNRTGIAPASAMELANGIHAASHLVLAGLHAYDGHLRDPDLAKRTIECNEGFAPVEALSAAIEQAWGQPISVIAGGTPSFPIHAQRPHVVCSPGTFIFWDKGYQTILPEQPFEFAALVLARIVSIPNDETITADLGHKAVASENPLDKRVYFLNAPDLQPVGHSEEHLALRAPKGHAYRVGDVLYGVPHHVCPTVALHEYAAVINQHRWTDTWQIVSRKRKVTV